MNDATNTTNGLFIQLDGIDGGGKSTLLNAARAWCDARCKTVFDTVAFSKQEHRPPALEDIGTADVLFTAEPTHAWIGKAIRDELIRTGAPYGARLAAQAFALDRAVQYQRLVTPFLTNRPDRMIIQDRGLVSSLAYQPLQSEIEKDAVPVTVKWLLSLDGNAVALETPPDAFVFLEVDPAVAQSRLNSRSHKVDNVRFEDPAFQTALAERYTRAETREPFERRGTRFVTINGGGTKDEVAVAMRAFLEQLTKNR